MYGTLLKFLKVYMKRLITLFHLTEFVVATVSGTTTSSFSPNSKKHKIAGKEIDQTVLSQ